MFIRNRKGQNTAEYAIVIGLIIAAVLAMQTYVKRGLQGRVKDAVDFDPAELAINIEGEGGNLGPLDFTGSQFEPNTTSDMNNRSSSGYTLSQADGGGEITKEGVSESSSRSGSITIGGVEE